MKYLSIVVDLLQIVVNIALIAVILRRWKR